MEIGRWNTSVDCILQTAGLQWPSGDQWEPPQKLIDLSGRAYVYRFLFVHNPKEGPTRVEILVSRGVETLQDDLLDALGQTKVVQFLNPIPDFFLKSNIDQFLMTKPFHCLRGLEVNFNDEDELAEFFCGYLPSCHLEFFSYGDPFCYADPISLAEPKLKLLRYLEHNTTITNRCRNERCRQRIGDDFRGHDFSAYRCEMEGILNMYKDDPRYGNWNGPEIYYVSRMVGIAERNRLLQQRVRNGVFGVLSFARLVLRAKNSDHNLSQLPYELIERIAYWAGGGHLTEAQIKRLLTHAVDVQATCRVASLFWYGDRRTFQRLREEWLHNGGFWWDKGYDAAREYIASMDEPGSNPEAQWPDPSNLNEVFRFLAFTPSKSEEARWLYEKGGNNVRAAIDICGGVEGLCT